MKLLVIGREGQLARSLAERGARLPELSIQCLGRPELDLMVPGSAAEAIARNNPDAVVNAAAYTAVDAAESNEAAAFRINADAAGELAAAASAAGVPLIHLSTDYVFDGRASEPYAEDAPINPLSVYGRSKLAGEQAVRAAGSHVIVRTAWVYSPFGRNFVRTIMSAAEQRDRLTVVDDQHGSPTSALDLADAILALVKRWADGDKATGRGETFHVVGAGETSWCGVAQAIMDERRRLGLNVAEVVPIRTADWPTPAQRPRNSVLDSRRFEREVGFAMPPWRGSLRTVVELISRAK